MMSTRPVIVQRAIRFILLAMPLAVLGNIAYTAYSTGRTGFQSLLSIPIYWLLLALAFSLLPWVFAYLRLAVWSRFFGLGLSRRALAEIVLANDLAAAATPTAMGGGYAKIGLLVYHKARPGLAASIMVMGSFEDYLSMALVVPVCWALYPPEHLSLSPLLHSVLGSAGRLTDFLPFTVITVSSAAIFVWAIPATRTMVVRLMSFSWLETRILAPLRRTVADFRNAFVLISRGGKAWLALNVVLAAMQWTMRYSIFTFMAAGLGLHPHPVTFFLLQWLVFMLMNLVPTPGAIGGAEVVFVLVFRGVIPPELLPIASGAWRFVSTYLQLIVAALLMLVLEKPNLRRRTVP